MKLALGLLQDEFLLSGETQCFLGWAEGARRQGFSVTTFGPKGPFLRAAPFRLSVRGEYPLRKLLELRQFETMAVDQSASADVLHLFLPSPVFTWLAARIQRRVRIPVWTTCLGRKPEIPRERLWNSPPAEWMFTALRYVSMRAFPDGPFSCERYLTASPAVTDQLRRAGCPAERILLTPHLLPSEGADTPISPNIPYRREKDLPWLFVGHFLPNKGWELLLEAYAQLEDHGSPLLLVWSGLGDRRRVEQCIGRLGLKERVRIEAGKVHRSGVMRMARALILPSPVSYGQVAPPLVALEGFRAGVPMVVPDWMTEYPWIRSGETVQTFEAGKAGSLVQAMRRILDEPEGAIAMAETQRLLYGNALSRCDFASIYFSSRARHG